MPYVSGVSINWAIVEEQVLILPVEPVGSCEDVQHIEEPEPAPIVIVAVSLYETDHQRRHSKPAISVMALLEQVRFNPLKHDWTCDAQSNY